MSAGGSGGGPGRPERIPLFRPYIREEAIAAVAETLRSGWLGVGPRTAAFEKAFAAYVGAPHCIGVSSCTAALHLALRLLKLDPGSEVVTTAVSFVSTNHVILYERCKPVFADVERSTGNLDVGSVAARLTERTRAIMLMHHGGYACDLDAFYALAAERGIPIVEDCAHACGATYKGRRIGSHGELHAFSFQAVKNLPMGDGGALTVRSAAHDERTRRLRWLGISADTYRRWGERSYRWEYEVPEVGYKYSMNDIAAAIGLAQLPFLGEDNRRRRELAEAYGAQLAGIPGVTLLRHEPDRESSHHLFCILVDDRSALVAKLGAAAIDVGVHYVRNDQYPMFERQELPNTEYFSRHVLSLPMHPRLTLEEVGRVCDVIRSGW